MDGILSKRSFWCGVPILFFGFVMMCLGLTADGPIRGSGRNASVTDPWQVVIAGVVIMVAGLALVGVAWRHRHD